MSAWRGEVNLLDLTKPEYRPLEPERRRIRHPADVRERNPVVDQAIEALARIGATRWSITRDPEPGLLDDLRPALHGDDLRIGASPPCGQSDEVAGGRLGADRSCPELPFQRHARSSPPRISSDTTHRSGSNRRSCAIRSLTFIGSA